jgi:hypothetical protein
MAKWTAQDFRRRHYTVEGPALDEARRVRLVLTVDGKTLVDVTGMEPGLVSFVSKPTEQGFEIDIVEGGALAGRVLPVGEAMWPVADWQKDALEVE